MKKICFFLAIIFLSVLAPANEDPNAAANALNNQGMQAYNKKNYTAAADFFRQAIEKSPDHILANYNLACMLALLYEPNKSSETYMGPCPGMSFIHDVVSQLAAAIKLDPAARDKARKDSDFNKVRDTLEFMLLLDPSPRNPALVSKILTSASSWYKPAIGVEGPGVLDFSTDSSFDISLPYFADEGGIQYESLSGTYIVDKSGGITLNYDNGSSVTTRITNGVIMIEDLRFDTTPDCGV